MDTQKIKVLTQEERYRLQAFFDEGASKIEVKDAYWIESNDDGADYCLACAQTQLVKEVARYRRLPRAKKTKFDRPRLGGGYRIEHDSTPFCEICGSVLDGSLTDYGCESEVEHFLAHGFDIDSDEDRRAMAEVIQARGWAAWEHRVYDREYQRERAHRYFDDLNALGQKILGQLSKHEDQESER